MKNDMYYQTDTDTSRNKNISFLKLSYGNFVSLDDYVVLEKENQQLKEQLQQKEDIEIIQGYVEMIENENQELKNQLENCYCNRTDCSSRIKDSKKYDSLVQKVEKQQKEFIKYLEDEIKILEENNIYQPLQRMALETHKHNLSKYKEIIGVKDEDN